MSPPDDPPRPDEERHAFAEESDSLWRITLAPATWAAHLVICYSGVSLACARGLFAPEPVRWALIALTLAALGLIAWLGWGSFRQWDVRRTGDLTNASGEAEDRHQFLGHAAFLLSVIAFIGTVFTALPLLLLAGCR